MKKFFFIVTLLLAAFSNISYSQFLPNLKLNHQSNNSAKLKSPIKLNSLPSSGASVGFNLGFGIIESEVAFALGAFAELKADDFAFVPQANYWNGSDQSNFELAGLARFYLSKKRLIPYLDGGLGVNFYNSDKDDFTKLSIIAGGGVELTNLGTSFNLLFDGKYKLIVNDGGNLSCFIFTVGMKFPFR
ncbi:MAG: hypothetical protein IPL53_12190 [Ignavibacteria bacterium]|nr:hypothetical protein [Ignavibacteria bacterium]